MGIYFEIRGNDFMGFGIDKDAVGILHHITFQNFTIMANTS
jgi:hypothetical protein